MIIWYSIVTMTRTEGQKNNPLHGVTLKMIVEELVAHYGFAALGQKIKIKCFTENPSINSSLTFLRHSGGRASGESPKVRLQKMICLSISYEPTS